METKYNVTEVSDMCSRNQKFRAYMKKEFEICPGWSITRDEYEGFPCAMQAWNWDDEKMTELAKKIAQEFEPIAYDINGEEHIVKYSDEIPKELENGFESLCDEFYTAIEHCAVEMGMQYYEDFTDDEDMEDLGNLVEFLKKC